MQATSLDSFSNITKSFYIPFENITYTDTDMPDISQVGELSKQKLYLTAHKLSQIHGSSPLLSMQRSSIIPTNYQLVPVIMALNEPRVRLLIADDVGLGKTIEAGLILNELIARQTAYKILVICPANLRDQWQEALKFQFKLDFKIISSLHKKVLEKELPVGASPWDYFNRLITSIDYVKSKAVRNTVLNYEWDLVLIDEAHLCARPHANAHYKQSTMLRWEFLERISKKAKHLLLLTATPHNGYTDSFSSLIGALDVNAVSAANTNFIDRKIAGSHICQRTRADVTAWLKLENSDFNPFPEQEKQEVKIESLSINEIKVYNALLSYGENILKMVPFTKGRNHLVSFTLLHFLKRFLSSPHSIRNSLRNRLEKLKIGSSDQEIKDSEAKATIVETDDIELFDSDEAGKRIERSLFEDEVTKFEIDTLSRILENAKKITFKNDSKFQTLVKEILPDLFSNSPKIIIFTRYKDTLDYLHNNLDNSLSDCDIFSIYGQMKSQQRREVFAGFDNSDKAILIATDCISEGINLQYLCSQIIHYELPWNPNRIEQRNGRVDRYGQPEDFVHIRTLIVENTLDELILKSIVEKADRMKLDYGFSPPFFSDEKQVLNLLYKAGLTPSTRKQSSDSQQLSIFDSIEKREAKLKEEERIQEEQLREQMDKIRSDSFYGHSDISLPDIEKKLRETAETIGSESEIKQFIISSLNLFNCSITEIDKYSIKITINDNRLLSPGMNRTIERATFDKKHAANHPNIELIDISHPLITRLINLIKQQSALSSDFYGRIAYKGSNQIQKTSIIMKALVRFVVETSPSSMVEEIITIGLEPYSKKQIPTDVISSFECEPSKLCNRTDEEIKEDIEEVLSSNEWKEYLEEKIKVKQKQLVQERENLINRIGSDEELPSWLDGITQVAFTRFDVLTITVGYPV